MKFFSSAQSTPKGRFLTFTFKVSAGDVSNPFPTSGLPTPKMTAIACQVEDRDS